MVLEEKTLDLQALLTAYAGGASPTVPMVPWLPTHVPMRASSRDFANKKRKRVQEGKGSKDAEEGEVTHSS